MIRLTDLLNIQEAASRARVTWETMWSLVKTGKVPSRKVTIGKVSAVRVAVADVDAWVGTLNRPKRKVAARERLSDGSRYNPSR